MKKISGFLFTIMLTASLCVIAFAAEVNAAEDNVQVSEEITEVSAENNSVELQQPEDGIYSAAFNTDSSMFRVNEAKEGRGILTVKDGEMTIHISLASKKIVNLFPGTADDAQKEGAQLLEPTIDSVTYSDGYSEDVYGFDVPVPYLNEEFDLAIIGTKEKWYDHKVSVTDLQPAGRTVEELELEDGAYIINVAMEGGSGKASITSPCRLEIKDGKAIAAIIWSSDKYDYMLVNDERFEPVTLEGGSTFEIPVEIFDAGMKVIGDTTAMSQPHEVEYTFTFDSESIDNAE